MKNTLLLSLSILIVNISCAQYFQEQDVFSGDYLEPYDFTQFDGYLYYLGEDDEELVNASMYRTNGIIGNVAKQESSDGEVFNVRTIIGVYQGDLYFYGNLGDNPGELWKLPAPDQNPIQITNTNDPEAEFFIPISSMRDVNGTLLFDLKISEDVVDGYELWTTDGTTEGTNLFLEINPEGDGFRNWLGELNGIQYFVGNNGEDGRELWRTDGTVGGTFMVKDVNTLGNGVFGEGIIYDDRLYFSGVTPENGGEIWSTDGTEEGTQLLIDLNEGPGDGPAFNPRFTLFNDRLFFVGSDGSAVGSEFWSTDGSSEGTELLADLVDGDATILNPTVFNGRIYFRFQDPNLSEPRSLWATDGTEEGTLQIAPDAPIIDPRDMFQVDNELVFLSNTEDNSRELWRTDGTDAGTYVIQPEGLEDQWEVQGWANFTVFGGRLFVEAFLNDDADLWSYGATDITLTTESLEAEDKMLVYPNPARDVIWVSSEIPLRAMRLYAFDGRLVRSEELNEATRLSLFISDLEAGGLYLLELESDRSRVVKKIQIAQ